MSNEPDVSGERLRQLRLMKGITQDKMSELADITPGYLGQIERGEKNPSIKTLKKIAIALGVKVESLFSSPSTDKDKHIQLLMDIVSSMSIENIDYVIKHAYIVKESTEKSYSYNSDNEKGKKKK